MAEKLVVLWVEYLVVELVVLTAEWTAVRLVERLVARMDDY